MEPNYERLIRCYADQKSLAWMRRFRMRKLSILLIISVLTWFTGPVYAEKSNVRIAGNRLLIAKRLTDGNLDKELPYTIKLVNWSPSRLGDTEPYKFFENYAVDIPIIKRMNANTIRVFDVIDRSRGLPPGTYISPAILDEMYRNGIMVILTAVWDHNVLNESYVKNVVRYFRDHPAVLMWSLGNEWNLWSELGKLYYDTFSDPGALEAAINATERAARWIKEAYQEAGLEPVPVASSIVYYWDEDPDMGWEPFSYYQHIVDSCPSIDAYGINMYQEPAKYVQLAREWAAAGFSKPLFIAEFGTDSYDSLNERENQAYQARYLELIWRTIREYFSTYNPNNVLLGGGIYEFHDEWWKMGSPSAHDVTGIEDPDVIDGYRSEEWMGVVDLGRNPKESYRTLAKIYPLRNYLNIGGSIRLKVWSSTDQSTLLSSFTKFYLDDQPYWRPITDKYDPRARGVNILVIDAQTLTIVDAKNFDTYEYPLPGGGPNETAMREFLSDVSANSLVLIGVSDTATYWQGQPFDELTYKLFESFGSTKIRGLGFRQAYLFVFKKNSNATFTSIVEAWDGSNNIIAEGTTIIENNFVLNCDIHDDIAAENPNIRTAAAIETQLRYTQQATGYSIPTQEELHNIARSYNLEQNQNTNYVDPVGLKSCLNVNQHPFYNFGALAFDRQSDAIAAICSWISYSVSRIGPQYIPAFFPAYGNYNNWTMVRGIQTDVDPQGQVGYTVKAFWIRDFSVNPDSLGANLYVSANDFKNVYLLPLNTPNEDMYEGKYVVVVEPPSEINFNFKLYEYESRFSISSRDVEVAYEKIIANDVAITDKSFFNYAHPLNQELTLSKGRNGMQNRFMVKDKKEHYWLFPTFEKMTYPKTRSMVAITGDGRFKAMSWTAVATDALPTDLDDVKKIIWYKLREKAGAWNLSLVRLEQDNIFRPTWRYVSRKGNIYHIKQDGSITLIKGRRF
jgi:hypothetical protein